MSEAAVRRPVAVVTGAGGLMGGAVAVALARGGYDLALGDRRPEAADRFCGPVRDEGAQEVVVVADVSSAAGAAELVRAARERLGPVDVLVNVAGGIKGPIANPIWEITDEQWERTIAVNLGTTYHCTKQVVTEMMTRRSGKIVNVASTEWAGGRDHAHYAAAKAAVVSFTRSVAVELGPYNVNVNVIAPGGTLTAVASRPEFPTSEEWASRNPLGRPNTPEDVADAVMFLVSERARNVTGQILNVAGGLNPSL